MADIVFRESFDHYSGYTDTTTGLVARWAGQDGLGQDGSGHWQLAAGRFGGFALRRYSLGTTGRGIAANLDSGVSEYTLGMAVKMDAYPTGYALLYRVKDSSGNWHGGLGVNTDGSLQFSRSGSASSVTLLGATSAPGILQPGAWNYFEISAQHSDAGTGAVYVNGDTNPVLSVTAQDFRNAGNATVTQLVLGGHISSNMLASYDDVYMTNAVSGGRLGPQRFESVYPASDVSNTGWTQSTGASVAGVLDESIFSTADWATASAVNDMVEMELTNMAATPTSITELNMIIDAYATDAGVRAIRGILNSGGNLQESSDIYLPSARGRREFRSLVDPTTGLPWTRAAVDALKARLKVTV